MSSKRGNEDLIEDTSEEHHQTKRSTRQNMPSCKVCKLTIALEFIDEDVISVMCRQCGDRYHGDCVGITSKFFYNLILTSKKGWLCHICQQDKFNYMNKIELKVDTISEKVQRNTVELASVKSSCETQFGLFAEKIVQMEANYQAQIDEMKAKLELSKNPETNHNQGNTTNKDQQSDITYMRNLQRRNNLIIQNVPILDNEDKHKLKQMIIRLAHACGYELSSSDIVSVMRLKQNRTQGQIEPRKPSSNAILVKLADVSIKDDLFSCYINNVNNKTPITTAGIGASGSKRIYINQHLSPELVKVKLKAVKLKELKIIDKLTACYNVIKIFKNGIWHKIYNTHQLDGLIKGNPQGPVSSDHPQNSPNTSMHFN